MASSARSSLATAEPTSQPLVSLNELLGDENVKAICLQLSRSAILPLGSKREVSTLSEDGVWEVRGEPKDDGPLWVTDDVTPRASKSAHQSVYFTAWSSGLRSRGWSFCTWRATHSSTQNEFRLVAWQTDPALGVKDPTTAKRLRHGSQSNQVTTMDAAAAAKCTLTFRWRADNQLWHGKWQGGNFPKVPGVASSTLSDVVGVEQQSGALGEPSAADTCRASDNRLMASTTARNPDEDGPPGDLAAHLADDRTLQTSVTLSRDGANSPTVEVSSYVRTADGVEGTRHLSGSYEDFRRYSHRAAIRIPKAHLGRTVFEVRKDMPDLNVVSYGATDNGRESLLSITCGQDGWGASLTAVENSGNTATVSRKDLQQSGDLFVEFSRPNALDPKGWTSKHVVRPSAPVSTSELLDPYHD